MRYSVEQRIAENRCDDCEEVMVGVGHDYAGPVICDACHAAVIARREESQMAGTVVHCKREPYDVYIGRPSKWGNPFAIGTDGTREEVIAKYRAWLIEQPLLVIALPELRGKTLGCWCAPQACHGDVLVELASGDEIGGGSDPRDH